MPGSIANSVNPVFDQLPRGVDQVNRAAFVKAILHVGVTRVGYPPSVWEHSVDVMARSVLTGGDTDSTELISVLNHEPLAKLLAT